MEKVHLVIGQNNTGKSNILRFAQTYLSALPKRGPFAFPSGLDLPRGESVTTGFRVSISVEVAESDLDEIVSGVGSNQYRPHAKEALRKILAAPAFRLTRDHLVWVALVVNESNAPDSRLVADPLVAESAFQQCDFTEPEVTGLRLLGESIVRSGTARPETYMNRVVQHLDLSAQVPPVATVAALRSISAEPTDGDDFSGRGLIRRLASLEGPGMDRLSDRDKFNDINKFVATVLEDESARITIPADQNVIHVISRGVELPLENLGTGLHEVIVMAAAATVLDQHLVCIEEPEVHLHPVLQRRLLAYLASNTTNRYLIATHSAHMLDARLATVSHVTLEGNRSVVKPATRLHELAGISADLGYRPSDLLQANAIIWVEGPSDRIYIAKWLSLVDPALIEGVHFSIMFYGGALLKGLTVSDQELAEFIDLRSLNHNLAIVIDSDRTRSGQRMNETKLRVKREFASSEVTGFPWITHGYTIENYVPVGLLAAAASRVNPGRVFSWGGSRYQNPLPGAKGKRAFDKSAIARDVCEAWDASIQMRDDLRRQLEMLAEFVRTANR